MFPIAAAAYSFSIFKYHINLKHQEYSELGIVDIRWQDNNDKRILLWHDIYTLNINFQNHAEWRLWSF